MKPPLSERQRWALQLTLLFALYVATEQLWHVVAIPPADTALIWLPNGVVVAYLLRVPKRRWWQVIVVFVLGELVGDYTLFVGQTYFPSHQLAVNVMSEAVNLAEIFGVVWLATTIAQGEVRVDRVRGVVAICVASVAVPAVTGLLGGWDFSWGYSSPYWLETRSWWFGDGVGYIVGVPCVLVVWDQAWRGLTASRPRRVQIAVAAVGIAIAVGATVLSVHSPQPSSQYVVIAMGLLLAITFGSVGGAAASLALICVTIIPLYRVGGTARVVDSQEFSFVVIAAILLIAAMTETAYRNRIALEKANEGLAASEGRARAIFSNAPVAMVVTDSGGHIESMNSAAYSTFRLPASASPSRVDQFAPYLSVERLAEWTRLPEVTGLTPGSSVALLDESEVTGRYWDGSGFPAELHVSAGRIGDGLHFFVAERDISRRKSMQARITEQEKLASLGAVTAGIAHQLQNPLNFVINFSEILDEDYRDFRSSQAASTPASPERLGEFLASGQDLVGKIATHGRAASRIVRRMLDQAHDRDTEPEPTDPNELVRSAIQMVTDDVPAGDTDSVTLVTELDASLHSVVLPPEEVQHAVANVIRNGYQAVLQRKAQEDGPYVPHVTVGTRDHGDTFEIYVTDNGVGVPDAIATMIFTPFFTTKEPGQGVGLGLSSSHSVIDDHNGTISCASRNGETTFRISLPKASAATPRAAMPLHGVARNGELD